MRPVPASEHDLEPAPPLTGEEAAALLAVTRALGAHRDRRALCAAIATALKTAVGTERLALIVPDLDGSAAVYGRDNASLVTETHIPGGSVTEWVLSERRALTVSSREHVSEQFPTTYEQLTELGMQSTLVLPLVVHERCLGALACFARATGAFDG